MVVMIPAIRRNPSHCEEASIRGLGPAALVQNILLELELLRRLLATRNVDPRNLGGAAMCARSLEVLVAPVVKEAMLTLVWGEPDILKEWISSRHSGLVS